MAYEDNMYCDDDDEPLMDDDEPLMDDDVDSDRKPSPERHHQLHDFEEDIDEWSCHDHSHTPIYDNDATQSKPQKRDIGKQAVAPKLQDEDEEEGYVLVSVEEVEGRKRKKGNEGGSVKKEKRMKGEKRFGSGKGLAKRKGRCVQMKKVRGEAWRKKKER